MTFYRTLMDYRNNFYPFIFSKIGINAEDLSIALRLVSL